ncbi:MAG TPA: NYN domain-containing protein [Thermoanaerobaculia bacterium]|nr:NYN domain-containing protein [Thermoanaerobaculia bacterium]
MSRETRIGVFIDSANISMNGGRGMRFDVLREFAVREGGEVARLNVYVSYDAKRAENDEEYKRGQFQFHSILRDFGYKVIQKPVKWFTDEKGQPISKANVDLEMAVDLLLQSEKLDRVVLATGDGDFVQVVRALQNRGLRVELVAFDNVSNELRGEADLFVSGYLVPNLLQVPDTEVAWGEVGSRVRGFCYFHSGKGYGFLRFIRAVGPNLWVVDTRNEASPYESVFFHDSKLPDKVSYLSLPSRNLIFEFTLVEPEPGGKSRWQAEEIRVAARL